MWTGPSVHSKMTSLDEDYLSRHPVPLQDPQDNSVIFLSYSPFYCRISFSLFLSNSVLSVNSLHESPYVGGLKKMTPEAISQGNFAGLISGTYTFPFVKAIRAKESTSKSVLLKLQSRETWDIVSLCRLGYTWICGPPAWTLWTPGLQAHPTMSSLEKQFLLQGCPDDGE